MQLSQNIKSTGVHFQRQQAEIYWLGVVLPQSLEDELFEESLLQHGMIKLHEEKKVFVMPIGEHSEESWQSVCDSLTARSDNGIKIAILPCRTEPSTSEVTANSQPIAVMQEVTRSFWLIDALDNKTIAPHFQPVVDAGGKRVGFESLARIISNDELLSGEKIITASHLLNIQHIVDRHLHDRTLEEYSTSDMDGLLFVNLIPGFSRKPSFYFDSLLQAAEAGKINADQIVLDITTVEQVVDISHLQKIVEQSQAEGFSVALEYISSAASASRLIDALRPEYIRLSAALTNDFCAGKDNGELKKILAIADEYGCKSIAMGVETEAQLSKLKATGIELFQGYLFGKPEPARKAKS